MGKVLIVEDDPALRFVLGEGLRDGDLDVVESHNADEALRCLQTMDEIDLVFSDVNMPGSMDGIGLAYVVRDKFPKTKIILTSGRPQLVGDVAFVPKPYQLDDMVSLIQTELARPSRTS